MKSRKTHYVKRKRADRASWSRVTKRRFAMTYMDVQDFRGYVTLLCIDEVREPLIMDFADGPVCVADTGYAWLQHFPQGANYTVTANFNVQGECVRWYIDICKPYLLDEQGMLWYDDLYLDLDVAPSGAVEVLDADELDAALKSGEVTPVDYELAWRELNTVMTALEEDMFPLLWLAEAHYEQMLKLV